MTNPTDRKLYELLGDGRTIFEPETLYSYGKMNYDEVPDKPTIADFHKLLNNTGDVFDWAQNSKEIYIKDSYGEKVIQYDSQKTLLNQSEETKLAIIALITNHS